MIESPSKKDLINLYHTHQLTYEQIGNKLGLSRMKIYRICQKFKIKSRTFGSRPLTEYRFLNLVMPEPNTGCWLWMGFINRYGYGTKTKSGKTQQVHRLSYELFRGEIPKGMNVCHSCDVPSCVNPDHLWLGTLKDNTQDMIKKRRHYHGERVSWSRLTTNDIITIRDIYASGLANMSTIALLYECNPSHIGDIIRKKIWKHI